MIREKCNLATGSPEPESVYENKCSLPLLWLLYTLFVETQAEADSGNAVFSAFVKKLLAYVEIIIIYFQNSLNNKSLFVQSSSHAAVPAPKEMNLQRLMDCALQSFLIIADFRKKAMP